jgi:RHS repeat-associated protein
VIEGGVVSFVRADHIARPVFATNSTVVKVWSATYHPFGGVHVSTGTLPTARFPGQWFQSESGLHQNWMRDYDPTTGRYLQPDPLGLIDGASVYGYVKQNPVRFIDPRGEMIVGPMSTMPSVDGGVEECVSQICTYQYHEDIDDARGSGFKGKICHYKCPNGKWFTTTQIGTQGCKPSIMKDAPLPFSVPAVPPLIIPRVPGGGGGWDPKRVIPVPVL